MVKCSSDTDKAHISESSATVIVVLLLLQYHCPPNLELHQHLSRACAGQFLVTNMKTLKETNRQNRVNYVIWICQHILSNVNYLGVEINNQETKINIILGENLNVGDNVYFCSA